VLELGEVSKVLPRCSHQTPRSSPPDVTLRDGQRDPAYVHANVATLGGADAWWSVSPCRVGWGGAYLPTSLSAPWHKFRRRERKDALLGASSVLHTTGPRVSEHSDRECSSNDIQCHSILIYLTKRSQRVYGIYPCVGSSDDDGRGLRRSFHSRSTLTSVVTVIPCSPKSSLSSLLSLLL
jgi:hypothetical protein